MVWIALAGIGLQAIGLLVAIRGVTSTYAAIVGRPMLPDLREDVATWYRTKIRRKPVSTVVTGSGAIVLTSSASGSASSRPPDPGENAPVTDQIAYLRQVVAIHDDGIIASRRHSEQLVDEATKRINRRVDNVAHDVTQAGQRLRTVEEGIAGQDGRGLRWAAVGLAVTLAGVLLTTAGLSW